MVEGVFIRSAELGGELGGFHSTFYVQAVSASDACRNIESLLRLRMERHGVVLGNSWFQRAHFLVCGLWDITKEKYDESASTDSGFTFFRVNAWDRVYLTLRGGYCRLITPGNVKHIRLRQHEKTRTLEL
jgi:hypothetical protein